MCFPIYLPPLRERGPDILLLADYFVLKYAPEFGKDIKRISTSAIDMLMSYHWPGNVRELENCVERAVLLSQETRSNPGTCPHPADETRRLANVSRGKLEALTSAFERDLITEALKDVRGNQSQAARFSGRPKGSFNTKSKNTE